MPFKETTHDRHKNHSRTAEHQRRAALAHAAGYDESIRSYTSAQGLRTRVLDRNPTRKRGRTPFKESTHDRHRNYSRRPEHQRRAALAHAAGYDELTGSYTSAQGSRTRILDRNPTRKRGTTPFKETTHDRRLGRTGRLQSGRTASNVTAWADSGCVNVTRQANRHIGGSDGSSVCRWCTRCCGPYMGSPQMGKPRCQA